MISMIPVRQLENVKEWVDSVDIRYTEKSTNLDWKKIMKVVLRAPMPSDTGWPRDSYARSERA